MRNLTATVALLALVGCASQSPAQSSAPAPALSDQLQKIAAFTLADLAAADADAVAHGDVIAHACYPALEKFVSGLPSPTGTVAGAFAAFQKARDLGNQAQAGVPSYLTIGCAPMVVDTQTLLAKLAGIGAGSAALSGAVFPIVVP